MARRRDFARGAHAISKKRLTTWAFITPEENAISASGAVLAISLNAAALALRPFTIVRLHLRIWLRSDQVVAAETQVVGLGAAVVSDQAVAVGVTAVPTPITDLGSNMWFAHTIVASDESRLVDVAKPQVHVSLDSKAMRKVEVGQDMIIAVEGGGVSNGMIVGFGGRFLIKNN